MSIAAQCPNCGAPIAFHVGSSIVTVCEHCSTVVARTDRALEDLGKTSDLVQTQSPLTLWMGGSFQGVGFQLTGRAQLRHGAGGVWDEWYLAFDDGRWGWLAEAQGRFFLTFRQPTAGPIDPQNLVPGHHVQVGDPPVAMVVAETGEAELLTGRGEIPYRFQPGQRYFYTDLSGQGGAFGTLDFSENPPALFLGREITLDELGVLTAGDAAPPPELQAMQSGAGASVEGVTCDNCGGSLELHAPGRTERVACPYCGAMHDCTQGVLRFLAAADREQVEPALPLGAQGTFEDQTFTLIGFMRRSTSSGWGTFSWEEYLLYNPRAGFRWLVYSDNHWNYMKPVPLADVVATGLPGEDQPADAIAEYDGKSYKIFQRGLARVDYVAGEFYWKVEVGQASATVDYVNPPEMLSGESNDNELQWTLGTFMTREEVDACFPDASPPDLAPLTVAPNQPYRHKGVYKAWGILIVLAFVALFWGLGKNQRRGVYSQTFELAVPASKQDIHFSDPFELRGGENIEIKALGARVDNSWMYVQADLFNQETGRVYEFDIPIEYYHGYSGGESWTEGSRVHTRYLSAVPGGTYMMRLAVERSDVKKPNALQITVSQGVFRWSYWLLAFLLSSIIPVAVLIHHRSFESRRWEESDFAGGVG